MELRDAWTVGILAAVFGVLTDRLLIGSGKKRKRIAVGCALFVAVYTVMSLVLRDSVMTAIKGGIFAMLLLCAAKEDCDTRIVGNYLSVEILLIGLIGIDADSIPKRLLLAAVSLIPVLLVERLSPKNPIGGADVKLVAASVFLIGSLWGFAGYLIGLLLGVLANLRSCRRKQAFPLVPYLAVGFLIAFCL